MEAALFVQIKTDNQIKSDAEANARLEERVRDKLKRYEQRLSHVEVHVSDANGGKGGTDKRVSLEVRPAGHAPIAVHADAHRVETAISAAVHKIERALAHAIGKQKDSKGH